MYEKKTIFLILVNMQNYCEVFELKVMKTLIIDEKLKFCRVDNNIGIHRSSKDSWKFLCKNQLELINITQETAISKFCVQLNVVHGNAYLLPYLLGNLGSHAQAFMHSGGSIMKIRAFFMFLKKLKIPILISDSVHKFLQIILISDVQISFRRFLSKIGHLL